MLNRVTDVDLDSQFAELVSNISHGLNIGIGGVFELASESPYVHIHCPIATVIVISPDLIEQSLSGKDFTFVAHQELQ